MKQIQVMLGVALSIGHSFLFVHINFALLHRIRKLALETKVRS